MNRKQSKKLNLDNRTKEDIERKVAELSGLYDTGWHMDDDRPDIGTTITKIFAGQVEENVGRVNDILERYHTEFVNMLDISLLPAKPSSTIVVMNLMSDTAPGASVPKGTKLMTGDDTPMIFETDHSLYVTSSRLVASFMADAEDGTIIPLYGDFDRPEIIPPELLAETVEEETTESAGQEEEEMSPVTAPLPYFPDEDDDDEESIPTFPPFTLFGEKEGIEQCVALFYHETVFDVVDDVIFARFSGNESLVADICAGKYHFEYLTKEGLRPIESIELMEDGETFMLHKEIEGRNVTIQDKPYQVLVLISDVPALENKKVKRVAFSSKGKPLPPDNVTNGTNDLEADSFLPFSDILALYQECYLCHDRYFSKAGAKISLDFSLVFEEHRIELTPEQEEENLKIIKRRPAAARQEFAAHCYAEEVMIEYFNGTGWKKLQLDSDQTTLFSTDKAGKIHISFTCPDDWESTESGSYEGRSIRLQLIKADNCYLRPAVHHCPKIKNLMLSYSYEDTFVDPQRMEAIYGTRRYDLTSKIKNEKGFLLFRKSDYNEDALYLGLSTRIDNGPASILFQLQDGMRFSGLKCRFEYRSYEGWRTMKLLDYTQDFTKSGVVVFMPPHDMQKITLEGHKLFWIRVVRVKKQKDDEDRALLPKIENISLNAVQVSNIETLPEVELYIEEMVPNMRFALGATNVLDADVWVNEAGRFSRETMLRMMDEDPENIRIEQDITGQITAFYVRWKETDRLETSDDPRVYLLDRLKNELIFGDGIHTWIPRVLDDVALRFSVRCCNGAEANIPAFSITDPLGYLMYVGRIYNPVKAYGGSNIEDLENALERGASILSSRNRIVSMDDYTRAILAYSDTIDQVAGIVGETVDGKIDDAAITFVLLMKDFMEGSYAFHRIVSGLKEYLMKRCELTVTEEKLQIIEPIYVDISVNVWANIVQMDDSFEIQNLLQESLKEYLDPLGYDRGRGWKIGTMPKKSQLMMRLNILKSRAVVKKAVMIASYTDHTGFHEVDLNDLKLTPFMICRSGQHEIHISI